MTPLDTLLQAVTKIKGASDSLIALSKGQADYIRAHANDPAALIAFANDLDAKANEQLAAVAANPLPDDNIPTP